MLFSCFFACYYAALYADSSALFDLRNSKGFAMHYPAPEEQITKEDIQRTADSYGVEIKEFGETDACNFLISYRCRDLNDDMQYITVENVQSKYALFFSEADYECLTGRKADVAYGTYKTVTTTNYKETIWDFKDGLWEASNPDTGKSLSLINSGTLEYDALAAMSDPYAYVLNDRDYAELSEGLAEIHKEHLVLFDVEDLSAAYPFGYDLMCQYVEHATDLSNHLSLYDAQEEKLAAEEGHEYGLAGKIDMSMDNALLLNDWKYAPGFVVVTNEMFLQIVCVYVMLCLYIVIITLAAAAIMSYVRSISIASDNRTLFENLSKLGAGKAYQRNILAKQLIKIFQYPSVLGCLTGFLFSAGMSWFNDGRYIASELKMLAFLLGFSLFVILFLY
ncbi:MAG: ABC transporter permease, partial [Lachnospiraceae bacterium]|nr:ABC transporter permease [Lachnospiraceae bacterium]